MLDNKNIIHAVIDIETLGTVKSMEFHGTCPILEAAIIPVVHVGGKWEVCFGNNVVFSLNDQIESHIDHETVEWHKKHNAKNYDAMITASISAPTDSSNEFNLLLKSIIERASDDGEEVHWWARGKDFEFPILFNYAICHNIEYPFMSDMDRRLIHCSRDLITFFNHKTALTNENPHRALSDADFEADVLAEILNSRGV